MTAAGITQAELARRMGVQQARVSSRYIEGLHQREWAQRYADALGVPVDQILEPPKPPKPPKLRETHTAFARIVASSGVQIIDLARAVGKSSTTVCRQLDSGIKSIRIAKQYAAALGCHPLELFDVEPCPPQPKAFDRMLPSSHPAAVVFNFINEAERLATPQPEKESTS
jgi:hypothetical protein